MARVQWIVYAADVCLMLFALLYSEMLANRHLMIRDCMYLRGAAMSIVHIIIVCYRRKLYAWRGRDWRALLLDACRLVAMAGLSFGSCLLAYAIQFHVLSSSFGFRKDVISATLPGNVRVVECFTGEDDCSGIAQDNLTQTLDLLADHACRAKSGCPGSPSYFGWAYECELTQYGCTVANTISLEDQSSPSDERSNGAGAAEGGQGEEEGGGGARGGDTANGG